MSRMLTDATPEEREALDRLEIARKALRQAQRTAAPIRKKLKAKGAWPTVKADRNAVRATPAAANPRQPRERNKEHLGFVRQLPCIATLIREGREVYGCEAAHVRASYSAAGWVNPGMQNKPSDWRTVPLTAEQHRTGPDAQHASGERAWWEALGVYPPDLCAALRCAFPDVEAGKRVIREFASKARA